MSPDLKMKLNAIVYNELRLSTMLLHEMNQAHTSGYNGFKRFFRYSSMDRQRHAIMLCNFVGDYCGTDLDIAVSVSTGPKRSSVEESINAIISESASHLESLKTACTMSSTDNELYLMKHICDMISDQSEELMRMKRISVDLTRPELDIRKFDKELHCKYKVLEKERFGYGSPKA
jgi:ferritin